MKTQPITIHRPIFSTDDYGNRQPTGNYEPDRTIRGWVGATRAQEFTEGRQTMTTSARMQLGPGEDVEETDEVTALGARWRVTSVLRQVRPTNPDREWFVSCDLERAE